MELKIKTLTGRVRNITVEDNATLEQVRQAIQDIQGCMPEHQALVLVKNGRKLADGWDEPAPISQMEVVSGDEIILVLRMDGSSYNRKYEPDLSDGSWTCGQCCLVNEISNGECELCSYAKPVNKAEIEKLRDSIISGEETRLMLDNQPGLDDSFASILLPAIASTSTLTGVVIGNVGLSSSGFAQVAEVCAKNKSITEFEIREPKTLSDHNGAAVGICKAFQNSTTIDDFGLRYMKQLTDAGIVDGVAPLVAANSSITKLSLCSNAIGHDGMKALAAALSSNKSCKVQSLDIGTQDTDSSATERAAEGFFTGISGPLSVEMLELNELKFSAAAAAAFVKFVESSNCRLKEITLSEIVAEPDDLAKMYEALIKCKTLQKLQTRSLNVNAPVGAAVGKFIAESKSLVEFEATYMTGDEKMYAAIGDGVAKSKTIKVVDVNGYTAETSAGFDAWCKAIQTSKTLENIAIGVQETDISKLAAALEASKSLKYFDVNFSLSKTEGDRFTTASASVYFREDDEEPSIFTDEVFEKHPTVLLLAKVAKKIIAAHKK